MSVYVLLYGIEWHKAKKFSKSQSFAVFGLKIYAKIAASSKPPMPEDLAKSFAKNERMCNVYSRLMLGKVTESNPVANTRRFTNARKNDSSSLVKPS